MPLSSEQFRYGVKRARKMENPFFILKFLLPNLWLSARQCCEWIKALTARDSILGYQEGACKAAMMDAKPTDKYIYHEGAGGVVFRIGCGYDRV